MPATKGNKLNKQDKAVKQKPSKEKQSSASELCTASSHCVDCGKEVLKTQAGLTCDACGFWHHTECEDVGDEIYEFLCDHPDNPTLAWYCKKCAAAGRRLVDMMKTMQEHQQQIELKVEQLEMANNKKMENVSAAIEEMRNSIESSIQALSQKNQPEELKINKSVIQVVQNCVEKAIDVKNSEERDEELEKERRKTNVIVHGIEEDKSQDSSEREEHDCNMVVAMLHDMNCDDVKVAKVIRLGKRPTDVSNSTDLDIKPRPMKLVLESEQQRYKVLQCAKNLRLSQEGALKKVFIHQDLTVKERQTRRELVKQLMDRRSQGEMDLIIVNNQIVRRRNVFINQQQPKNTATASAPVTI